MNALLQIQIRVQAAQANAALQQVNNQVKNLGRTTAGTAGMGGFFGGMGKASSGLIKMGKNLQWTGQQLTYNFTLPLALAAGAATKWAMANERAFTEVSKVYGDLSMDQKVLQSELQDLRKSFELLSTRFGVHQEEVIRIGAAWAQAGSSGLGLAKSVRLTLETMTLGGMGWEKAVEGMIGIQSAFKLNTDELKQTMADLNIIENQTGISFEGLIDVVSRAGGVARTAGIEIKELAAMSAAIVPAAGTAAQAGNALRTMISRIMAPTKESSELMAQMGINIFDASWQAQDGMGRIRTLAGAFMELDDAQKTVVSSSIASRWQINRFDLLMEQVDEHTRKGAEAVGFFARALEATSDPARAMQQYNKELLTFLGSSPKQFDILINLLRNELTKAIQPMIPVFIMFLKEVGKVAQAFNNLSPSTKAWILMLLLALATLGPMLRLLSALQILLGLVGLAFSKVGAAALFVATQVFPLVLKSLAFLGRGIMTLLGTLATGIGRVLMIMWRQIIVQLGRMIMVGIAALASALGLPIWAVVAIIAAAVLVIAALFNDDLRGAIGDFFSWLASGLAAIPRWFGQMAEAVGRLISGWIEDVMEALSWLNPFAQHSPSLVENVTAGINIILGQYARLRAIPGILASSMHALERFNDVTAPARRRFEDAEFAEMRTDVVAAAPEAGGAFDGLVAAIRKLRPVLSDLKQEMSLQEMVVKAWEERLEEANAALEAQERILDNLQRTASMYKDQLDMANEQLDLLKDTPIEGMGAMADAIFENEMAQKRLRLEILKMGDAAEEIDKLKKRLAELQGDIELTRARVAELRAGGAGSEILAPLEAEIANMERMREEMRRALRDNPVEELEKQLEELQRQGEILDLENSLKFDPLQRQIEKVTESMQEMPFDRLLAAIIEQQEEVDRLNGLWVESERQVTAQEQVVQTYKDTRDQIQVTYDAEKDKLEALSDAYSFIENQLRDMEQALNSLASSAKKTNDELSMAQQLFEAAEGHNFEDVGGTTGIGREAGDIAAWNQELQAEIDKVLSDMDFTDALTKPFSDLWNALKEGGSIMVHGVGEWVGHILGTMFGSAGDWISRNFSREGIENFIGSVREAFGSTDELTKREQAAADAAIKLGNDHRQAAAELEGPVVTAFDIGTAAVNEFGATSIEEWRTSLQSNIQQGMAAFDGMGQQSKLTLADIKTQLTNSIADAQAWSAGLIEIAKEGHPALAAELAKMGPAAAGAVQEARNKSSTELDQMEALFKTKAELTGTNFATGLEAAISSNLAGVGTETADLFGSDFKTQLGAIFGEEYQAWMADLIFPGTDLLKHVPIQGNTGIIGGGPGVMGGGGLLSGTGQTVNRSPVYGGANRSPLVGNQEGGIFSGAQLALVGEGSRIFPEYLIPTDPRHRARALQLYQQLGQQLVGMSRANGPVTGGAATQPIASGQQGESREIHFHGDLSFPNITSADQAEIFVRNLVSLAK